jgi:hemerythrin
MVTINWTEEFSVGVESIDWQHKELFTLLNDFYKGFEQRTTQEKLLDLITKLADYASKHFSEEEEQMGKCDYPKLEEHKLEHRKFIGKVEDYKLRHRNKKLLLTIEVTNFIREWLTNHIKVVDKKYSQYMIEAGIR